MSRSALSASAGPQNVALVALGDLLADEKS